MPHAPDRPAFAARVRQARREAYGDEGVARLALELGLPPRTWEKYEAGVMIPDLVLLKFLCLTGATPRWLLTGEGRPEPARPEPNTRRGRD